MLLYTHHDNNLNWHGGRSIIVPQIQRPPTARARPRAQFMRGELREYPKYPKRGRRRLLMAAMPTSAFVTYLYRMGKILTYLGTRVLYSAPCLPRKDGTHRLNSSA